jgi:hypothetical protein
MRNAFVQDWRGFWLVGGLTGFLGTIFGDDAGRGVPAKM